MMILVTNTQPTCDHDRVGAGPEVVPGHAAVVAVVRLLQAPNGQGVEVRLRGRARPNQAAGDLL